MIKCHVFSNEKLKRKKFKKDGGVLEKFFYDKKHFKLFDFFGISANTTSHTVQSDKENVSIYFVDI